MALKPKAVAPSFESILDTPMEDVKRPRPLPQGTYLCIVKGHHRPDKSRDKGTEFSEFTLQVLEASDDVDQEELKEVLTKPNGDVMSLRDMTLRVTFYHTDNSIYRLEKFLRDLGIAPRNDDGSKKSLTEGMQEVPGRQIWAHVIHKPSQDGETVYANVDKTALVQ